MEGQIVIVGTLIIGFLVLGILILRKKEQKTDPTLVTWLTSMQQSLDRTREAVNGTLRDSTTNVTNSLSTNTKQVNERLDQAAQVIGDLKKQLGELSEVGRGMKSLQEFLQSPKLRGGIGEEVLTDMLGQTFPKHAFYLQYAFQSGVKVDAILKTDAGLLPIDAKFPMENFRAMHEGEIEEDRKKAKKEFLSDVKKHITDISKKYILPLEGTLDFALMYIPAESIYYEIANNAELMEVAKRARVYPVSPSTMYAHLQVLLTSFQGKEFEQKSKEVLRLLRGIQKDYEKIAGELSVLTKHITNAHNSMGSVHHAFDAMGSKLSRHALDTPVEPEKLMEEPGSPPSRG